jgi:hypothetical protein
MDDERRNPVLPVLCAWLVPGAGHLTIGRLWPGIFMFAAILPLFVAGLALAGFENVSPERHPIWFYAIHVWGGALTAAATFLTRDVRLTEPPVDQGVGELFTGVACLLNLIAAVDVWARCSRGDPETRTRPGVDTPPPAAEAVPAPGVASPAPETPLGP